MDIAVVISALLFFLISFALAYFIGKSKQSRLEEKNENLTQTAEQAELRLSNEMDKAEAKLSAETARANKAEKELTKFQAEFSHLEEKLDQILKPFGEKISEF
jgi:peptidoglycan hydrolase CwlO-like protein